jgi:DnaJ-class molecular chaperone
MNENHKECQDCGWRGNDAQLDRTDKGPDNQSHIFCPDCGGTAVIDQKPDDIETEPDS